MFAFENLTGEGYLPCVDRCALHFVKRVCRDLVDAPQVKRLADGMLQMELLASRENVLSPVWRKWQVGAEIYAHSALSNSGSGRFCERADLSMFS